MAFVHILHENDTWTAPLRAELSKLGIPHRDWFLNGGVVDFDSSPPAGVFYNRMSASSHTRDHRFAAEHTKAVLSWLEGHDRFVVNDSRALALEIDKAGQYRALQAHGVRTPRTVAAVGREAVLEAARQLGSWPLITKPNRGGKGLGVRLFRSPEALSDYVRGETFEAPLDGTTLVQEYVESPDGVITRLEFVGGRFLYAVRVDTTEGFELCPADACAPGDAFCPAGEAPKPKFEILRDFRHPLVPRLESFLAANGMKIAAVEVVEDANARTYAYDVNVNTNYNSEAEARAGLSGMGAVARYLGESLRSLTRVEEDVFCALA